MKILMFSIPGQVFQGFRENETTENSVTKRKSKSIIKIYGQKIVDVSTDKNVQNPNIKTQKPLPCDETNTTKIGKYTKRSTDATSFDHDVLEAGPFQLNSHRGQILASTFSRHAESATDHTINKREKNLSLKCRIQQRKHQQQ